ncbi:MAG: cellulase family glycosylhydrolase, partial [Oscillospiraceae bacterium]
LGMAGFGASDAQLNLSPAAISVSAAAAVKVKTLKLSSSKVTMPVGKTYTIKSKITPSNATNQKLSYSSSDSKIAKVSSKGVVTAVKEGTATITVKTTDKSNLSAKLTVVVKNSSSAASTSISTSTSSSNGFDTKITAMELVEDMQIGFNLGNTLDASNAWSSISNEGLNSETCWGNPKTTKAMIDAIKAEGFNTIRIPVTWHNHLDSNYNVKADWMKRVKEVVDYAVDNDMYIIINMHHDNLIYDLSKAIKSTNGYNEVEKNYLKVWSQIADTFKNYDEHLIFESMNEPHIDGSAAAWNGGTAKERDAVNKLNAAFTKFIRKSGGNNKYRFLMLPCYAASSSDNALNAVKFPDDNRLILSVHAYIPYNFAFNGSGTKTFSQVEKNELDRFFKGLNDKFVKKGIPVVIGEMGATNKDNLSDRIAWAKYYVSGARKYNITCLWWDNGGFNVGGENFGLFDRMTCKFKFKDIADALVKYSK